MKATESAVVKAVGKAMQEVNSRIAKLRNKFEDTGEVSRENAAKTAQPTFQGVNDIVQKQLFDAYVESYYREMYELQTRLGYYWKPRKISTGEALTTIFGYIKGKDWKQRIQRWYRGYANAISAITQGAKFGIPQNEINDLIRHETGERGESGLSYKIMRIVRTESNAAMNRASMTAYKQVGIKRYKIVSLMDDRVCVYCHEVQNGRIYPVSKARKTVNLPPFHPNCRCYVEPVLNRDAQRYAKKKGKKEKLTYAQWRRKYT